MICHSWNTSCLPIRKRFPIPTALKMQLIPTNCSSASPALCSFPRSLGNTLSLCLPAFLLNFRESRRPWKYEFLFRGASTYDVWAGSIGSPNSWPRETTSVAEDRGQKNIAIRHHMCMLPYCDGSLYFTASTCTFGLPLLLFPVLIHPKGRLQDRCCGYR